MIAGPLVGDHFTLNLYNKVIPLFKFENIGVFFKISLGIFFWPFTYFRRKKKKKRKEKKNLFFTFRYYMMG